MNENKSRFAPLGLYLSLAAALAAAGLYIVQRQFNLALQVAIGLIIVGLALFAILDPSRVRTAFMGRQARYGSNMLVMMLAFIGILVVANLLAYNNNHRWDLTDDKANTLAPETVSTLQSLPEPVTAVAFYTSRMDATSARNLLNNYKINSGGKFDYQFVDPEADPLKAREYNIVRDGTIVLQMGSAKEPVTLVNEQELTSTMLKLLNPGSRVIYFLTGHGEHSLEEAGDFAYLSVKSSLESKNYTVKPLSLLVDRAIPEDAKAVVIAGPQKPLDPDEVTLLKDYVNRGGSLVVMEEPLPYTDFGDSSDPLADYLAADWGAALGKDVVIDMGTQSLSVAVADTYGNHAITQRMQGMVTVFPDTRSVQVAEKDGITATTLVSTSQQSWAETDFEALKQNQVQADEGADTFGPIPIAAALENSSNGARAVVIGDSDFAVDAYFNQYGNSDFIINAIDWAARQDALINLTPKAQTQRLVVPPNRYSLGLIFLGTVFIVPGLVLISGIINWVRRRRG